MTSTRFWRDKMPLNAFLASIEELEEKGNWNLVDYNYVLSCHNVRKVKQIEVYGGVNTPPRSNNIPVFQAKDPYEWMLALQLAQQEEQQYFEMLTSDHGYPDTRNMDWRQAHHLRLQHLMVKYPQADWTLLQKGQFDGWDRKPKERKAPAVPTIQIMETAKRRYLLQIQQINELTAFGEVDNDFVSDWQQRLERHERQLVQFGFNIASLLQDNASFVEPIFLEQQQIQQPVQEQVQQLEQRITELSSLVAEMVSDEQDRESGLPENRLLIPTQRVLAHYTQVLKSLGVVGEPGGREEQSTSVETTESLVMPINNVDAVVEPRGTKAVAGEDVRATFTAQEVGNIVGFHYQTTIKYLASGELPFGKKTGSKWTVAKEPFLAWLDSNDDVVRELAAPKPRTGSKSKVVETSSQKFIHGRSASF